MFRQRVTVTLDPSLVEAADILVDGATVRSRSHAFEVLMHEGLGLSNLDTLVVITEDSWAAAALTQLIALLQGITWKQAHLVSSSNLPDAPALLSSLEQALLLTWNRLPGEFGDGGALSLLKGQVTNSMLVVWLGDTLSVPQSILPAFAFHRQHHSSVTELIATSKEGYSTTGLAIIQPEVCDSIPAGKSSLRADIFPSLAKQGRVRAYVTT